MTKASSDLSKQSTASPGARDRHRDQTEGDEMSRCYSGGMSVSACVMYKREAGVEGVREQSGRHTIIPLCFINP